VSPSPSPPPRCLAERGLQTSNTKANQFQKFFEVAACFADRAFIMS
jgi:hypothetical protein